MALGASSVRLAAQDAYLLPRPFTGTNFTLPFVDTVFATNSSANATFQLAHDALAVALDADFARIVGPSATARVAATGSSSSSDDTPGFAFEAGVWVPPPLNQVWFTSHLSTTPGHLSILDLDTSRVFRPALTGAPLPNPNGGYLHDGTVYVTFFGNETYSPGIVAIDPHTHHATEVVNSYFGLPLNGPDDVAVVTTTTRGQQQQQQKCIFFTDFFFAAEGIPGTWPGPQQLSNAVWRLRDHSLEAVLSTQDVLEPNGIAIDHRNSVLYVTDGPDAFVFGRPLNGTTGSPGIYAFDLGGDDGCSLSNKRLVGFARGAFANGIKVDARGRVWTAEHKGGIVVRNQEGRVLGWFNVGGDRAELANFALAGDALVVLDFDRIVVVELAENVVSPGLDAPVG